MDEVERNATHIYTTCRILMRMQDTQGLESMLECIDKIIYAYEHDFGVKRRPDSIYDEGVEILNRLAQRPRF